MIVAWASTYLGLVVAPFMTLGPVIAKESLGGAASWGLIMAGWGTGAVAGACARPGADAPGAAGAGAKAGQDDVVDAEIVDEDKK